MFVPRPKVLSVRRDNPCGCPRTRNNSLTLPGQESFIKIKLPARFTARWHALGNPRRGFPTQKHSTGIFLLPSCAFVKKEISLRARSDQRFHLWIPPPLKRRAKFYFRVGSLRLAFPFPPDRGFYQAQRRRSATARKVLSWQMSGGPGYFYYKVKAAICRTAARARKVLHKADTGLKNQDKIALPTRIRCARRHRGTPGEGSPRQNSPPDCFASPPALLQGKEFRSVRGATKDAVFGFCRL